MPEDISDLSDLVPGDDVAIKDCLGWLELLGREISDTAAAVQAHIKARRCGKAAREVIADQARVELGSLASAIRKTAGRLQGVVSAAVIARAAPLFAEAERACGQLAVALPGLGPADKRLGSWLAGMAVLQAIQQRMGRLLVARLAVPLRVARAAQEARCTEGDSVPTLDRLREYAARTLRGAERKVVELLCDGDGHRPLADLGVQMEWAYPRRGYKAARQRLNPKLELLTPPWDISCQQGVVTLQQLRQGAAKRHEIRH